MPRNLAAAAGAANNWRADAGGGVMPRIALIVNSLQAGGAERVASHLVNAWVERGNCVTLLVTDSRRGAPFYPIREQVNLVYLVDLGRSNRQGLWGYWAKFRALRKFVSGNPFDVVISFATHVSIAMLLACAGLRIRLLVAERTYPPLAPMGFWWAWLRRHLYPRANRVVMQTNKGQQWLEEHIGSARGVVIPNPVQLPLAGVGALVSPEQLVGPDVKVILAVGRLDKGKQFDHLIQAFAARADVFPDWHLVILGEGPERAYLNALVTGAGLGGRIVLPGQAGNMTAWYQRASFFALTSKFEGMPNALLEALAHGCPAVSYDCDTGPRDLIRDGIDGILVAPGDVAALGEALQSMMQNAHLRQGMAAQAITVCERFSIDVVLAKWEQLFEQQ